MPPYTINNLVEAADQILNSGGRWNYTIPTTSKLLHFMCPALFPIYDSNINKMMFGGQVNCEKYHAYIFGLQQFLNDTEMRDELPIHFWTGILFYNH